MEKLRKETYKEYRKIYRNQKWKSIECYCDVCKNDNKLHCKRKISSFKN